MSLVGADWRLQDLPRALLGAIDARGAILQLEEYLERLMEVSVMATENGRSALKLGLRALGLGKGEGVVVPTLVCPTVVKAIVNAGCRPVFADVAEGQLTVSANTLEPLLTADVRAVIVPHLYCLSTQIREIEDLCHQKGTYLIDDAAQSFGLRCDGRYLGTYGDMGVLSFGPFKGVGALRGGALVSRNSELIRSARTFNLQKEHFLTPLRRCASGYFKYFRRQKYFDKRCNASGYPNANQNPKVTNTSSDGGFMLTGLDAVLTRFTLEKHEAILQRRILSAKRVFQALEGNTMFAFFGSSDLPYVKIPVRLNDGYSARDVVLGLRKLKIEAEHLYLPAHLRDPFKQYVAGPLPNAEQAQKQSFLLPNPYHQDAGAVDRLASAVETLTRLL